MRHRKKRNHRDTEILTEVTEMNGCAPVARNVIPLVILGVSVPERNHGRAIMRWGRATPWRVFMRNDA
jgi:hypothetical protein